MLWVNQNNGSYQLGMFPGLLFGIRSYEDGDFQVEHVLYLGLFDICLTLYYEE